MWANFKTNCFRTRFTFIWNKISYFVWNKIVLFYIKQYLSNFFAPTLRVSVTSSPNEIRTHYYKLPFVGPFSTYAQHRIKRLTQRCCKNLVIKLVFAPYKIKNLFSAKDAISNLSRSLPLFLPWSDWRTKKVAIEKNSGKKKQQMANMTWNVLIITIFKIFNSMRGTTV